MYHKLNVENSCNTVYRINMVSFRYIIVNTVYKGGNRNNDYDDDNNNNNNNNNNISETFRKYVSNIPRNHDVKELQKTAILGTAHILRKVLM